MTRHVTPAAGNIFADLGFDAGEAEAPRIRSTLIAAVRRLIRERGLTRTAAAALVGITEARVSERMDGHIGEFTVDTLLQMLAHAGCRAEVQVLESA